jgi:hypothetical protein
MFGDIAIVEPEDPWPDEDDVDIIDPSRAA